MIGDGPAAKARAFLLSGTHASANGHFTTKREDIGG